MTSTKRRTPLSLQVRRPAFCLCAVREKKSLVITIKGSTSVNDAITDLDANNVPFPCEPLQVAKLCVSLRGALGYMMLRGVFGQICCRGPK